MNTVIYMFLSENFKKSFLKACKCAAGREVNVTLQVKHYVFSCRQTLAGMEALAKNAAINRFQQARDQTRFKDNKTSANGKDQSHKVNDLGKTT